MDAHLIGRPGLIGIFFLFGGPLKIVFRIVQKVEIKGFEVTRLGHRHRAEPVIQATDPRGLPMYWIGPAGPEQDAGPGTDFDAIRRGYISITPIHVDLTRYQALEQVSGWVSEIAFDRIKAPGAKA